MGDYDEKKYDNDYQNYGFVVIISLIRYIGSGVSKLSVAIPQDIDPLDAPDWIVRMFPSWEINNVHMVSPQQALEFFDE